VNLVTAVRNQSRPLICTSAVCHRIGRIGLSVCSRILGSQLIHDRFSGRSAPESAGMEPYLIVHLHDRLSVLVCSFRESSNTCISITPFDPHGIYSTWNPISSSFRQLSKTAGCSMLEVMIFVSSSFSSCELRQTSGGYCLLPSVPPEVK
jgi:hypothetical protein